MTKSQFAHDPQAIKNLKRDVIWAVFGNKNPTTDLTTRQLEALQGEVKYHELTSTNECFQNCHSPRTKYTFDREAYDHYLKLVMADYTYTVAA